MVWGYRGTDGFLISLGPRESDARSFWILKRGPKVADELAAEG